MEVRGRVAEMVCRDYAWISDLYIIDYWIDELWDKLPSSLKQLEVLEDSEWANVLDETVCLALRNPLPLSILCLRRLLSSYSLCNQSYHEMNLFLGLSDEEWTRYSSMTVYDKRGVKEKKRGEIERIVPLVRVMKDRSGFSTLVDIGAGLGHLTRALASSLPELRVKSVEGCESFVKRAAELDVKRRGEGVERVFSWVDQNTKIGDDDSVGVCLSGLHACGDLSPSILRLSSAQPTVSSCLLFSCCYHKLNGGMDKLFRQEWEGVEDRVVECRGFPMSDRFKECTLSYAARELACHSKYMFIKQMRSQNPPVHTHHALRALAEMLIVRVGGRRHEGLRGGGGEEKVEAYLEKALAGHSQLRDDVFRVLNAQHFLSSSLPSLVENSTRRLVTLYCLRLLIAPFVEDLILLDRLQFLREQGWNASIHKLFDPVQSPRCYAIMGLRSTVPCDDK